MKKNIYSFSALTFYFLVTTSCLLLPLSSLAQTGPAIQWQNTIGGSGSDQLFSSQHTTDGGYILGGFSESNISGDKTENCIGWVDYWIVKTDSIGNIQWQNTIGGNMNDAITVIKQTLDGGYILGGTSESNISNDKTENNIGSWDYWIVKVDFSGNIQWQNTIGGTGPDVLYSLHQTTDGGYILGGTSNSNVSGDKTENCIGGPDYWIVKTDSLGITQWQNTIGGNGFEEMSFIEQTPDGGYILGGYSDSDISGDKTENSNGDYDYWIIKTSSTGNIVWQSTIGGNSSDVLSVLQQTTDGGYILGGSSISNISGDKTENSVGFYDYWIVKTDSIGNITWQNTIGGNDNEWLSSVQQTTDGGYILGGDSKSNSSGDKIENSIGENDFWYLKIDSIGNISWQNTLGGSTKDILYNFHQTSNFEYFLAGYSNSNISGDKTENSLGSDDYWIIKLGPDTITSITTPHTNTQTLTLSPNPAKDNITLQLPTRLNFLNYPNPQITQSTNYPITISILSTIGQIIYTSTVSNTAKQVIIPVSTYPKGMYVVKVVSGDRVYASKFVIN